MDPDRLDEAPCAYLAFTDEGRIVDANRRLLAELGHADDDLVGASLDVVMPPASRLYLQAQVRPVLQLRGHVEEVHLVLRTRCGTARPVLASATRAAGVVPAVNRLAMLPMDRRHEFEQRLIEARRAAEELLRLRGELIERRETEVREHAALATHLRALAARLDAEHSANARAAARSLHEQVAQDVAALRWGLDALRRRAAEHDLPAHVARLERLADQTLAQVRELSYDLHPPIVEHADLAGVVRAAVRDAADTHPADIDVTAGKDLPAVDASAKLALYRFVEEALRNAVQHGHAARIAVDVRATPDGVRVAVADEGRGVADDVVRSTRGLGLLAVRERLRRHGGSLEILARAGGGITIEATLPRSASTAAGEA